MTGARHSQEDQAHLDAALEHALSAGGQLQGEDIMPADFRGMRQQRTPLASGRPRRALDTDPPAPPVYAAILGGSTFRVRSDVWPADDPGELTQIPNVRAFALQGHGRAAFEHLKPGTPLSLILDDGSYRSFKVKANEEFEHLGAWSTESLPDRARLPFRSVSTGHTVAPGDLLDSMFSMPFLVLYTCTERACFDRRRFVIGDPTKGR